MNEKVSQAVATADPASRVAAPNHRWQYLRASAWLGCHALAVSLVILLCSTSVRLFMVMRADPDQSVIQYADAPTYLSPAKSLLDDGVFLDSKGKLMVDRTPGYPLFLASIMFVVGRNLGRLLIVQAIILSMGPVILYWLARKILPPVAALTAGLIASLSPWGAVLAGVPMSDGLFLFLLSVIFLAMKVTGELSGGAAFALALGAGFLTGFNVLVRPIWPLVALIPAGFLFCYGLRLKRIWALALIMLMTAAAPVLLWKQRNSSEAHFNGLSDVAGATAWLYLAARVKAELSGESRHAVSTEAYLEEHRWKLPLSRQEVDDERWRRVKAVVREHPFVTLYSFGRSAFEHAIHPSPDVLRGARLNFYGDIAVLAFFWGALLLLSAYGIFQMLQHPDLDGDVNRRWLVMMLLICGALTLSSGISFAAGSRLRAPLEAIVPMLAALGMVRAGRAMAADSRRTVN